MTQVILGKSRVREICMPGSVRAKAEWLSYSTFNVAVVINKTQFPEFVHEKTHARSRRADHLRQCLLADFRYDWLRPTFILQQWL